MSKNKNCNDCKYFDKKNETCFVSNENWLKDQNVPHTCYPNLKKSPIQTGPIYDRQLYGHERAIQE